jgi:hypothetical protein
VFASRRHEDNPWFAYAQMPSEERNGITRLTSEDAATLNSNPEKAWRKKQYRLERVASPLLFWIFILRFGRWKSADIKPGCGFKSFLQTQQFDAVRRDLISQPLVCCVRRHSPMVAPLFCQLQYLVVVEGDTLNVSTRLRHRAVAIGPAR